MKSAIVGITSGLLTIAGLYFVYKTVIEPFVDNPDYGSTSYKLTREILDIYEQEMGVIPSAGQLSLAMIQVRDGQLTMQQFRINVRKNKEQLRDAATKESKKSSKLGDTAEETAEYLEAERAINQKNREKALKAALIGMLSCILVLIIIMLGIYIIMKKNNISIRTVRTLQ